MGEHIDGLIRFLDGDKQQISFALSRASAPKIGHLLHRPETSGSTVKLLTKLREDLEDKTLSESIRTLMRSERMWLYRIVNCSKKVDKQGSPGRTLLEDLTEHFAQTSAIEDVHRAKFKDSGKCRRGRDSLPFLLQKLFVALALLRGENKGEEGSLDFPTRPRSKSHALLCKTQHGVPRRVFKDSVDGRAVLFLFRSHASLLHHSFSSSRGHRCRGPGKKVNWPSRP
nr:hypothetical protein CFP56_69074 [Quercus suber]